MPPEEHSQLPPSSQPPATPPPGPPKKGFWGAIAGLFSKQPKPQDIVGAGTPSQTPPPELGDVDRSAPLEEEQSQSEQSQGEQPQQTDQQPQGQQSPEQQAQSVDPGAPATGEGGESVSGALDISQEQVPQTEEQAAPNEEGERMPPTVNVPDSVKAPTTEENEDNPPTLPSEPEAAAGEADDTSVPDEEKPADTPPKF